MVPADSPVSATECVLVKDVCSGDVCPYEVAMPYSSCVSLASFVLQVITAEFVVSDDAKIEEMTGAVMSGGVHVCVRVGRLVVVPQAFASVQVRVCELLEHADQAAQIQDSVHTKGAKSRPSSMLQPSAPVS